ncbi:serine hydrolase domain-containing protein [Nonomuraea sp. ZG12]|uniref:serine hydrolase domain-containing protein n=1 Tax=Nonomuraea sp. ZG12 TaxID=3452207 RepID=UPI003F8C06E4
MARRTAHRLVAAVVVGALALAPLTPALAATDPGLEERLDRLTGEGGVAGALARTSDGVTVVSGTAERGTGLPMVGADASFRVGSLSKPVIAVTVMRLVERGEIKLGAPVERYLPEVLRGQGAGAAIDGRKITVRDLLRHTSGLPDFSEAVDWSKLPQDYLKVALGLKPTPVGQFAYSNTNYLVLGKIIHAVTGEDFRQVSRELVIKPLRMRDTYWPRRGEMGIRGEHAHTYGVSPADPEGGVVDLTRLPGYEFGASGGLVSTPDDLNRFWRGVPAKTLRAMTADAVRVGAPGWPAKARYGLGAAQARLSCGEVWMHGGDVPGVSVLSGRTRAGRAATVYVTGSAATERQRERLLDAFDTAMCG